MRDLIISVVLFALMITAIVGNSIFVCKEAKLLRDAVSRVPSIDAPECKNRIGELRIYWRDFKKVARLSLSYSELNRMECLIEEMECHRQTGNANDFEHAKVMMMNVLNEIERHERVSLDGVM